MSVAFGDSPLYLVAHTLCATRYRGDVTASSFIAAALAADPLFCDLLANVPLHLEHEVAVERVLEFKQISFIAVTGIADSIAEHVQGISQQLALDVVTFSPNGLNSSKTWPHDPPGRDPGRHGGARNHAMLRVRGGRQLRR
jgi:hypothetical protein